MSKMPAILMSLPASLTVVNHTLEMLGRGPGNVSVALVAIGDTEATHETPATAYFMQDMSAQDADVSRWTALVDGTAPTVDDQSNPIAWGVDVLPYTTDNGQPIVSPTEAQVVAAWGSENVQVIARSTFAEYDDERPRAERPPTPTEWRDETLEQESYRLRPEPPLF